jgi:hypothetical protein
MGDFFKKGEKKTTQDVPEWLKEQFQTDFEQGQQLYGEARGIANDLINNPREILGPDALEREGLDSVLAGIETGEMKLGEMERLLGLSEGQLAGMGDTVDQAKDTLTEGYDESRAALDDLGIPRDALTAMLGDTDMSMDDIRASYENAFTDDVVDTTLAGMDRKQQQELARLAAEGAAVGGTTNTRGAVADAVLTNLHNMDRAKTEAGLRSDAFNTAAEFGLQEADLRRILAGDLSDLSFEEQAALQGLADGEAGGLLDIAGAEGSIADRLSGLGSDYGKMGGMYADLGNQRGMAQAGFGELSRNLQQQQMDETRTAGKQAYSWLSDIYGKTRGQKANATETTQETASPFQQALGTAVAAAGAFAQSDETTKDVRQKGLDETGPGALDTVRNLGGLERYAYKSGEGHRSDEHHGYMAQRVEKADPDLVSEGVGGTKHVDSYALMTTIAEAVAELDRKVEAATA